MSYSIAEPLFYDILSDTKGSELNPFEQLYIAENVSLPKHERYYCDLLLECGCFKKAIEYYTQLDHPRKLGDLSWIIGDFTAAKKNYSIGEKRDHSIFRSGKDWDRLVKLAFFTEKWKEVIDYLLKAPISQGIGKGRIVLGNSEAAGTPYLNMLAIALAKSPIKQSTELTNLITDIFQIKKTEWERLKVSIAESIDQNIKKIKKRCPPRNIKKQSCSLEEACLKGKTPRAQAVLTFLNEADMLLIKAIKYLHNYVDNGKEDDLSSFLNIVLSPGIKSVSQTFLFSAFDNDGFNPKNKSSDRLVRLYSCHPIMDKRYFGRLLNVKFSHGKDISGNDLLTGIFQEINSVSYVLKNMTEKTEKLDFNRLLSCRDWAESKLSDWAQINKKKIFEEVIKFWKKLTAKKVCGPFDNIPHYPESPREMNEWKLLIKSAYSWLEKEWSKEIGISPWISENKMYQMIKRIFKPKEVIQHAQPIWLAPQHLDVFIPEISVAFEYQGKQHYELVGIFGGEEGLKRTIEMDIKKKSVCESCGIKLFYVRHDEDMKKRLNEIKNDII